MVYKSSIQQAIVIILEYHLSTSYSAFYIKIRAVDD